MAEHRIPHRVGNTELIDTPAAFKRALGALETCNIFAFDTEFDRFYREYGFKMSLLQVADGKHCFLFDPIRLDLSPLWTFFEDPGVCKIVYSCSEDVQLLKINNCNPQNIYDLQIAAKLCNISANSLSDLIFHFTGHRSDKALQRSNWRRRPLSAEQLKYAGNDVSCLLDIHAEIEKLAHERKVGKLIAAENRKCEMIMVSVFEVKLSVQQKRKYDSATQKLLLELFHWRDAVAQQYNVPPANIVSDGTLEEIITEKKPFIANPFSKGFSKFLADDKRNRKAFLDILQHLPDRVHVKEALLKRTSPQETKEAAETEFDRKYAALYNEITDVYGKESGEFILRGFRKMMSGFPGKKTTLTGYQKEIIEAACRKLGLSF